MLSSKQKRIAGISTVGITAGILIASSSKLLLMAQKNSVSNEIRDPDVTLQQFKQDYANLPPESQKQVTEAARTSTVSDYTTSLIASPVMAPALIIRGSDVFKGIDTLVDRYTAKREFALREQMSPVEKLLFDLPKENVSTAQFTHGFNSLVPADKETVTKLIKEKTPERFSQELMSPYLMSGSEKLIKAEPKGELKEKLDLFISKRNVVMKDQVKYQTKAAPKL